MGFFYSRRIFDKRGICRLRTLNEYFHICRHYQSKTVELKSEKISAREIRQLFLDYFVKEKNHTYVHSSPVFLNNDPSLLFVNAGMNQFRTLLMNKTHSGHPLYGLKRAANSQKCIRLSGKHNDLADVGKDLHHHTFFEMLGNWSFGDYSKKEACEMAWELLTKIYGLNSENLYVTYFNGDTKLGVPPDEECKNIWLDIGVHPSHIFPFGTKDNFWDMGDIGPCGPCTEIHYDFLSSGFESATQRINSGRSDLIEIWNLVFIQYNRLQDGMLKALSSLNVDTGMGFERLTAVIQGTMSNYDTDIFIPLFKAIEKNFKVRSYKGKTGCDDVDGLDTAYRILADHCRMFTVSIADGLFPDYNDAGSVLRKIIRRAAYTANRVMKTRPGILTSLVPYVAESLDFYPEIGKHVKEVIDIVNEEEKLFHQLVNKGRKVRNKMVSESTGNVLDGWKLWELHEIHGLEENVIQDLLLEVNILPDWESYKQVMKEKQQLRSSHFGEKSNNMLEMLKILENESIPVTNDIFKYRHYTDKKNFGVESITSSVLAVIRDGKLSSEVQKGNHCIIITDKTNFYSEAGGQVSDVGNIYGKDFSFEVEDVTSSHGFVFHHGTVTDGTLKCEQVQMCVNEAHRLACAQNHTATHLLNAALRKILPYTLQRSSYVGPKHLRLGFSARKVLNTEQVKEIESFVRSCIEQKLIVKRLEMPFEVLLDNPKAVVLRGEEYPEIVSVIAVECNRDESELISLEPCCGTHVHNTADLLDFTVIPSKSFGGSTKSLSAVTGIQASVVRKNGEFLEKELFQLKTEVDETLQKINVPLDAISVHLKKVKSLTKECHLSNDAPLLKLEEYKDILREMKLKLNDVINSLSETDANSVSSKSDVLVNPNSGTSEEVLDFFRANNISPTADEYKYKFSNEAVVPITAKICAVIENDKITDSIERGLRCQLVLDKTNFYAEGDDQSGDEGVISCEAFVFKVINVYKVNGYVFHDGYVEEGKVKSESEVNLFVNKEHRLACSQNHTALHLLNSALKKELPYFYQQYALAGPKELYLSFTTKALLSVEQLKNIEKCINDCICANMDIVKSVIPINELKEFPQYKSSLLKDFKEDIPVIVIEDNAGKSNLKSTEPCCGTHVSHTSDLDLFIITSYKTDKNKEKVIRAVTGKQAKVVQRDGEAYNDMMLQLQQHVTSCLEKPKVDFLELWDCLKEIKLAKGYHETELPFFLFRDHQNKLTELTKKLTEATNDFVQDGFQKVKAEMELVLKDYSNEKFIVHKLQSVGDGKRIINFALENSGGKPALYFAQDGHKAVICSCVVPEQFVQPSFSALLWINPVAALLNGRARSLTKDPTLVYSVICERVDKVDEAVDVAKQFVQSHLN